VDLLTSNLFSGPIIQGQDKSLIQNYKINKFCKRMKENFNLIEQDQKIGGLGSKLCTIFEEIENQQFF